MTTYNPIHYKARLPALYLVFNIIWYDVACVYRLCGYILFIVILLDNSDLINIIAAISLLFSVLFLAVVLPFPIFSIPAFGSNN